MQLHGWIEEQGHILTPREIETLTPDRLSRCGGEFLLTTPDLTARDHYGIIPGPIPPGTIRTSAGDLIITPDVPDLPLETAVQEAVRLRTTENAVVTLSGGVDSALIAALARLPCIAVGLPESHDLLAAEQAADLLDLPLTTCQITDQDILEALPRIRAALPGATRMDLELALTGYFIGRTAKSCGAEKILTGQAADELFAGYARYSRTATLRADLDRDFLGLAAQRTRDSTAVGLSGVWYSLPYMDERVVRASRRLTDTDLISGDQRKLALRKIAARHLPEKLAWKPKKAMQYGSGITAALRRLQKQHNLQL